MIILMQLMTSKLKQTARKFLLTSPFQSYFANRVSIEIWPGFYGRAQEIKVASLSTPLPERTATCGSNIKIILKLLKSVAHLPGDVAECGVYQGSTLIPTGLFLYQNKISKTLFGCDSFEGFNEDVLAEISLGGADDPQKKLGGFGDTSYSVLKKKLQRLGLNEQVQLVKGYFEKSLPELSDRRFSFVHLDCDLYDSYKTCLEFFYPRLEQGGIILFDEYNDAAWPGCNKAVDEFLAEKQEKPVEIEADNYLKYYITKL